MRAISVLAILAATPAASSAPSLQFDLVCSGTLSTKSFHSGDEAKPYRYLYRLDLAQKKWCPESCTVIKEIHQVQPGMLVLDPPVDINTVTEKRFESGFIDRQTGKHQMLSSSGRGTNILILKWDGTCESRPFSGFPEIKTKF